MRDQIEEINDGLNRGGAEKSSVPSRKVSEMHGSVEDDGAPEGSKEIEKMKNKIKSLEL